VRRRRRGVRGGTLLAASNGGPRFMSSLLPAPFHGSRCRAPGRRRRLVRSYNVPPGELSARCLLFFFSFARPADESKPCSVTAPPGRRPHEQRSENVAKGKPFQGPVSLRFSGLIGELSINPNEPPGKD